jgi:hypothetical protein
MRPPRKRVRAVLELLSKARPVANKVPSDPHINAGPRDPLRREPR